MALGHCSNDLDLNNFTAFGWMKLTRHALVAVGEACCCDSNLSFEK